MTKTLVRLFLALVLAAGLAGCWDLRQPEETGIVVGLGIDREEDGTIVLLAQTVRPRPPGAGGGGGGGRQDPKPFHNWYATGETVFDAVRNLSLLSPNKMFFAHNKVFVISERLAKEGVVDVLDFFERDPEIKQSGWVVVARGELEDIMQSSEFGQQPPAQMLADVLELNSRNTKYGVSTLADFIQSLNNPGAGAFTAGVTHFTGVIKDQEDMAKTVAQAKRPQELRVSETAIFNEDKLVGWFNPTEGRGLLWIRGEVQQGLVIFRHEHKRATFEIFGSNAKLKPVIRDGRLVVRVEIKASGNLGEVSPGVYVMDVEKLKALESSLGQAIAAEVWSAVRKAQELNTDVLGFGSAVNRAFPQQWNKEYSKEWKDIFGNLEVEVVAEGRIRGLGLISTSVNPRQKP